MNDEKATGGIKPTIDMTPIKTGGQKMTRKMHGQEKQMRLRGQLPPAIQPAAINRMASVRDSKHYGNLPSSTHRATAR